MRITAIRSHIVSLGFRNGIFTEIETDVGIVGYSETVLKRLSRTIATGITELGHTLIGQDPRRVEDHYEKLYRDSFWVGGPMHASIISALEIALWDILGKELGLPLYRLFGGPTRDRVLLYAHCQSGDSPAQFASNARASGKATAPSRPPFPAFTAPAREQAPLIQARAVKSTAA